MTTTSLHAHCSAVTSVAQKLLNIFVSPAEVFEEVIVSPPTLVHWLAPLLFVCLTGLVSLLVLPPAEWDSTRAQPSAMSTTSASSGTAKPLSHDSATAILTVAASTVAGTVWSTTVLWLIGRVFLKTRFSFLKTLEVVALSGMILGLGTIVTALIGLATDDAASRPALSLLAGQSDMGARARAALDAANFFHLWAATVLAIGLSRLARVSFPESAFWVLGYWVALRVAMICLV